MSKQPKQITVRELGTRRVAQLMNLSPSRIVQMCDEGKLVASQPYSGASWRILLPESEYLRLVQIEQLRKN